MRIFAPLAERDLPVPGELLDALVEALGAPGRWVLIGAAARDLALILGGVTLPRRATNDVDIAIAAQDAVDFDAMLATIGEPTRAWQRRRLLGQQVDVVPFGDLERDGEVVIHESSLSVLGCAEAAAADIRIGGRRVGGKRGGLGGFKVDAACAAGQMAGIELHVAVGQDADVLLGAEGAVVLQVVAALAAV